MQTNYRNVYLAGTAVLAFMICWLVSGHVFFWDTIQLGSKHAHWYYDHQFSQWLLPTEIDSGHPPVFGMYLALLWTWFGKTLWVSHLAMFPFLWGILYLLFRLGDWFGNGKYVLALPLLAMVDPVLAGQSTLISPDLLLVFCFLLAVNSILEEKQLLLVLACMGLVLISTRGMMVTFLLFVFRSWVIYKPEDSLANLNYWFKRMLPFVPAGILALSFLSIHYYYTGWVGYHPDSPWAYGFQRVGWSGFARNMAILVRKVLEEGRILIWILLFLLSRAWLKKLGWRSILQHPQIGVALKLCICTLVFLSPSYLLFQGLHSLRYLLPFFLALNFLFFSFWVHTVLTSNWRRYMYVLALLGLFTGNYWIYPDKVSQDWDCTLAHLPYYNLRNQFLHYLSEQNVPPAKIGTAFPEIGPWKYKDLSGSELGFKAKNLQKDSLIFYSNVMNDFTDQEIDDLRNFWKVKQRFDNAGVSLILYEKRN
ncbi:MAG: hypothetical protein DHS20C18_18100 [Saprospiraceae bacterium]|nr:MAG: hypothetical protein DHS20C18_18100 [Saprospiraceae bacterium]